MATLERQIIEGDILHTVTTPYNFEMKHVLTFTATQNGETVQTGTLTIYGQSLGNIDDIARGWIFEKKQQILDKLATINIQ